MFWKEIFNTQELICMLRIIIASICGLIIGFERKIRQKDAGIRTHTIVALGSALIMTVSKYGFGDTEAGDAGRIAAQIVSGIGFLGAGMIMYRRDMIRGLTSAAGIWATAGIGMAIGAGMYFTGIACTFLLVAIQFLLHRDMNIFKEKKYYIISLRIINIDEDKIDEIKNIFGCKSFITLRAVEDRCDISLRTDRSFSSKELIHIKRTYGYIASVDRNPDHGE